jgi:hypothetical protein
VPERAGSLRVSVVSSRCPPPHEIPVAGVADDIPVLPSGLANVDNMQGFMADLAGNRNQIDTPALIDQESHPASIVASFCRLRCIGAWSCQG